MSTIPRYRNPRTGRFERDPLSAPNWPIDSHAPTPIWDALISESARSSSRVERPLPPVRRPILRQPTTPPAELPTAEIRTRVPIAAGLGAVALMALLAVGLWVLAAQGGGAAVGILTWLLLAFMASLALAEMKRAGRIRQEIERRSSQDRREVA